MTTIVIADDHPMMSAGIEVLLSGSPYRLIGRARDGIEALDLVKRVDPDIMLLDVHMPDGSGIDALRSLRLVGERPQVILLTAGLDDRLLLDAEALCPDGIVLKTADPALLFDCLEKVRAGGRWVDPEITVRLSELTDKGLDANMLAPRERQLVTLVRRGLKNRDIAEELGVTEGTVKVYMHTLFRKLGVASRTELAMRTSEFG